MNKHTVEMLGRLQQAGISTEDALALRRIAMTLHRWYELECGTGDDWTYSIERDGDEDDSPPYMRAQGWISRGQWSDTKYRIPDRENGAKKRLARIMSKYPGFAAYLQTDPRGAPLYIIPRNHIRPDENVCAEWLSCNYTRGIAVYK